VIGLIRRHRLVAAFVAVGGVGLVVFVLLWFQPQKLVIDKKVDEALPSSPPAPAAPALPASPTPHAGVFRSFEHPTSGRALVVDAAQGRVLRFELFETSNGPDVVVYLSAAFPRSIGDESVTKDFVDLGPLKGNVGNQNYQIPAGTDLARYSNVVVWCRRFKVSFGAAQLR